MSLSLGELEKASQVSHSFLFTACVNTKTFTGNGGDDDDDKGRFIKVRTPSQDVREMEIECFLLAFFAFFFFFFFFFFPIQPDS